MSPCSVKHDLLISSTDISIASNGHTSGNFSGVTLALLDTNTCCVTNSLEVIRGGCEEESGCAM